jgi:hypothetical protein
MTDEIRGAQSEGRGLSRRAALKGVGAGAALAWTAPAVLSVGNEAFAAGSADRCPTCAPYTCTGADAACGTPPCHCAQRAEDGACVCYDNSGLCAPPGSPNPCATDADCVALGFTTCFTLNGCEQNGCGSTTFCSNACPTGAEAGQGVGPTPG